MGKHQRTSNLPPEPKRHEDLDEHVLGGEFKKAELDHLHSHAQMQTWTEVAKSDPAVKDHQMLDCMWVYVYKFDKHGRLAKQVVDNVFLDLTRKTLSSQHSSTSDCAYLMIWSFSLSGSPGLAAELIVCLLKSRRCSFESFRHHHSIGDCP
jgi:hypothetical protein